ncbi:hypothetical protein [Prosthecobacter sp.]|uniref:hypothetical protein n=1 Tax=Prosthecobacter sp. TaxID=1965333 RepID=UPI002AB8CEEF|nr:hypothetical protein [Prosthecobacter sp.]MDZ4403038.1 hypothetical protein [Prosthecobacter sp.]
MNDPKQNMAAILRHIKDAEKELSAALALFEKFSKKGSKNGARRMDALIKARMTIAVVRSHLPQDWQESGWFDDAEHLDFLNALVKEMNPERGDRS